MKSDFGPTTNTVAEMGYTFIFTCVYEGRRNGRSHGLERQRLQRRNATHAEQLAARVLSARGLEIAHTRLQQHVVELLGRCSQIVHRVLRVVLQTVL